MSDDFDPDDSNLVQHARRELKAAGLYDEDSDYGGMIAEAVEELVTVFARQGHSGFSAGMAVSLFSKLADFKPLGPLTDRESEWNDVADFGGGRDLWQSARQSDAFSEDRGFTYYVLSEERRWIPWHIRRWLRKRSIYWVYPRHRSAATGFILGVAE